jgi:hypothetical protein
LLGLVETRTIVCAKRYEVDLGAIVLLCSVAFLFVTTASGHSKARCNQGNYVAKRKEKVSGTYATPGTSLKKNRDLSQSLRSNEAMINDLPSIAVAVPSTSSHEPYYKLKRGFDLVVAPTTIVLLEVLYNRTGTAARISSAFYPPLLFLGT